MAVMGWFAKLRDKLHSVDLILSDFNEAIDRLERSIAHHEKKAESANVNAAIHAAIADTAQAEAARAATVVGKVKALIS